MAGDISERLHGLSPERRQLFELLQKARDRAAASRLPASPASRTEAFSLIPQADRERLPQDVEDAYPLSSTQAGMIYHMELSTEYLFYQNVDSWHLRTPFDHLKLEEAIQRAVDRHDTLRTSFDLKSYSAPLQLVHRQARLPVAVEDLRELPAAAQQEVIDAYGESEKRRPIDKAVPPLLRIKIHRRSADSFQFTLTEFHPILDGWSLQLTLSEILTCYSALIAGSPPPLEPPLAIRFREFVRLEQEALRSEEHKRYWRETLEHCHVLELPRWPPGFRPPGRRPVRTEYVAVAAEVFAALKGLAERERLPLKSFLLAAHAKLLSLVSGRPDVLTGLIRHGRPEEVDGEQVRGLFLNALPFRYVLEPGSWLDLVRGVFAKEQEILPFARYPLAAIQRDLGVPRLIETAFNLTHFHLYRSLSLTMPLEQLGGRELEENSFTLGVTFNMDPEATRLMTVLMADMREIAVPQLLSISGCLTAILAVMTAAPGEPHDAAVLLGEAERQAVLIEWSATAPAPRTEVCVHELFEAQARRTPAAIALISGEERLSYAAVDLRADALARRLRRRGVGPEVRVGVCMQRQPGLVVALLAVLKAGGAYVPIDPAYPAARQRRLLEDSGAGVLLVSDATPSGLVGEGIPPVVRLDEAENAGVRGLEGSAGPANLAYVMYTSGSTGRPKGVAVEHRSAVALLEWVREVFRPAELAGMLAATATSFDLSVFELFAPLSWGGTAILVENALALPSLPPDAGVTLVNTVPSVMAELARLGALPATVRTVNLGGEAPARSLVRELLGRQGIETVWNLYGPTEATVYATGARLQADDPSAPAIGRPVAGTRAYVLDRWLQPMPLGAPGELYLGGAGLARGYLGRADLTAESFLPDPFGEPGSRLYRTGDLAAHRSGGDLSFLGRIDHQIKLRGFRIELGEIETALAEQPGVREAVVMARQESAGERRLVAYVVLQAGAAPTAADLRSALRAALPDYMVPWAFVTLDALPLTPNGKLDRRALARLEVAGERVLETGSEAPRTPAEEVVAGIWAEVLGLERVGARDHFFELGGHSLLATRVVSRLRDAFGVELPLRALFEQPTVAGLAGLIETARRAGQMAAAPALTPVQRPDRLPLSFAQERLWFLDQLQPNSPAYNIPLSQHLAGPLAAAALAAALAEIVRRHEVLRTVYRAPRGEPIQVVLAPRPFQLPILDLSGLPEAARQAEAQRLAGREALLPFDLSRGPMLRAGLVRLAPEEHVVVATLHHIAGDGWSRGVLVRELQLLYEAARQGLPSPLPPLPVQYADFALWQRGWLRGEMLESEVAYWQRRLAGAPPLLELPLDRPRPAVQSSRGARIGFLLAPEVSRSLQALARHHGATTFMVLLAGFQALLARWSGQQDVSVGTPIAGRRRAEIEGLIGLFVNTLVVRTDLSGDPGLGQLLAQVRERSLEAYLHQDLPFERLVEALAPERSLGHSPLFQVMLTFENLPPERLDVPGLSASPFGEEAGMERFDLTLALVQGPRNVAGVLSYNTDLFDGATMRRFLGHHERLLAEAVASPDRSLRELTLLLAGERQQVVVERNDTAAAYPAAACVHELVAAQAARTPAAVAVSCGGEALSYGELAALAARLARRLAELGVGPEVRVGLCVERSPALLVALLGVLGAGGAYVPLDPAHPPERLGSILSDSGARVLLAERALLAVLPPHAARLVLLGEVLEEAAGPAAGEEAAAEVEAGAPRRGAEPEHLAYVIYTSGSTGRPKGVGVRHRGVVNYLAAMAARPGLGAGDVMMAVTTLAFDIAVTELWLPLVVGARIELVSRATAADAARLGECLETSGATCMQATPATWNLLLEGGWAGRPGLRALCGGEALPRALAESLLPRVGELWNLYGPTETTVWSALLRVSPDEGPVPLGGPLGNTTLHLLGRRGELIPLGVVGELAIGGAGLARGYLGKPELTAERFVPDPWSEAAGERLYRTGDLVRYRAAGALEFLGRVDQQVKLRGFRIEPGEIETLLAGQPGVREAVVMARQEAAGDRRLVAYVVLQAGAAPTAADLRSVLRAALPDYMVPSAFVTLEALPLTPHGKLDRRALAALEVAGERVLETGSEAPRTPAEEVVAGIWAEVLGLERVGARDHFFELGGHSLLATRVVSRLRDAFGVELPLRALFEEPTVAGLAGLVETAQRAGHVAAAPPLAPRPVGSSLEGSTLSPDRLPLSFAQERLWFLDQLRPNSPAYNIPLSQRLAGPLAAAALAAAFTEIVRRHEVLRTVYRAPRGEPIQVVLPPRPFPLPLLDLSRLPEAAQRAEAARLAGREALLPFDLARHPMLRAGLLRLAPEEHVVIATMHHIASDGWSRSVLVRELQLLYEAAQQGRPSPLPPLPIQYADFAIWQREWLQGEVLETELAYWRQRLAGAPPLLELPVDRPRPAVQGSRGARLEFQLAPEVLRSLQALARRQGATMFMVLLAGFQALLARCSGQQDVSVGTPIAGRRRSEIEGMIGFFVNTLVMRTELVGDPGLAQLLAQVRERSLEAYLHQDLPFEKLVEALAPERSLSHAPLFQAMLTFDNLPQERLEVPGLSARPFGEEAATEKFDLSLALMQEPRHVAGVFSYNTDLFDGATMRRLLGHYERLLAASTADPARRFSQLSLLGEAERQAVLIEWSATAPAARRAGGLHELFEAQAARTPAAVAVVFRRERLTYEELDRRSEGLADRLVACGVGADVRVGVCLERSLELMVSLLGVMKAGGAYVPLDPGLPAERLRFMLADSGAAVLLTESRLLDRWPGTPVTALCLDRLAVPRPRRSTARSAVDPQQLAYVMYTSGSTGRPKGVMIPHRGAVNYLQWCIAAYAAGLGQGAPVHTSSGFDLTVTSLWAPLLAGRSVFLLSESSPAAALAAAEEGGFDLSLVKITPSHLEVLADQLPDPSLAARGGVWVIGGDALRYEALAPWRALAPRARWVNEYGPTETVVGCCVHEVAADDPQVGPVPIGRPIAGTRVYVVDGWGSAVPAGAPGELLVGGAGLARGYLDRPELTAERFVPDPWSEAAGERLYRTGDLVRYRAAGALEFLGRVDQQVKLRGFRIEPGEIEATLLHHPGVRQAAVVLREDIPGSPRLVAYIVAADGAAAPAPAVLAEHVGRSLPESMVPTAFMALEALPLTANGKLDRQRLPRLDAASQAAGQIPPRDLVELQLARIWEEILHVEAVGATASFFTLGGHSLLAVRLMSRIEAQFGQRLPIAALFESPTLGSLAARLRHGGPVLRRAALVPLQEGAGAPLFLAHPVGGNVLCYWQLAHALGHDVPIYGLQLPEIELPGKALWSIESLAAHYLQALSTVQPQGPYRLAGWSLGGVIAFEMARQLERAGRQVSLLALIDAFAPGPGAGGPVEGSALVRRFAEDFAGVFGLDDLEVPATETAALHALYELGRTYGRLPQDLTEDAIEQLYAMFKTCSTALASYRAEPYGGGLLLFTADRSRDRAADATLGWSELALGGISTRQLPGDHYGLMQPPVVQELAAELRALLASGASGVPQRDHRIDRGGPAGRQVVGEQGDPGQQ